MNEPIFVNQLNYLKKFYEQGIEGQENRILARREGDNFHFQAFGEPCKLTPEGIYLNGQPDKNWTGLLIAIYALYVGEEPLRLYPLQSYKQIAGSIAFKGASGPYPEKDLIPHVGQIQRCRDKVIHVFGGHDNKGLQGARGDFSFTLYPLPKIPQFYNFYLADEEFPASITTLFAANAKSLLPIDTIGDVAYCTVRKILEIVTQR